MNFIMTLRRNYLKLNVWLEVSKHQQFSPSTVKLSKSTKTKTNRLHYSRSTTKLNYYNTYYANSRYAYNLKVRVPSAEYVVFGFGVCGTAWLAGRLL